jgi:hypothetical protein
MIVTGIEITHYHYCSSSARHVANVCMTLKDRIVTLLCALDLPDTESASDRTRAFVGEASRQLGRMPEFRSGHDTLEFADGLLNGPMVRYC